MDVQMFFCAATVVSQWLTLRRSNPKAPKICHESKTACWEDLSLITQLKHAVDEAINDLRNDSFSTSSHNLVQHQTFEFIMWGIRLPNAFLLTSPLMFPLIIPHNFFLNTRAKRFLCRLMGNSHWDFDVLQLMRKFQNSLPAFTDVQQLSLNYVSRQSEKTAIQTFSYGDHRKLILQRRLLSPRSVGCDKMREIRNY